VATDLFGGSLEETNLLAIYNYLPRRWDFGVGVFHFKDYFSSRITTLGEQLGNPRLFSERRYGVLASASYPFDRFRRVEFNLTVMGDDRQFFDENLYGDLFVVSKELKTITSPSISVVTDNTLYGYYGPVNGQRLNLTYSPALGVFTDALEYQTATFDGRRYWDLTHGYTFAGRTLVGVSDGRDPQIFSVGGYSTLRGFRDFDLLGSRIVLLNTEVRFPFIQQLGLVGPLPIGVFNLRGAVFADGGLVWNRGEALRWEPIKPYLGADHQNGYGVGFGVGVRTFLLFALLKVDTAWATDFHNVSRPRWHVSLGPEF
jgi:outer membrane protein assembly factor BamA